MVVDVYGMDDSLVELLEKADGTDAAAGQRVGDAHVFSVQCVEKNNGDISIELHDGIVEDIELF